MNNLHPAIKIFIEKVNSDLPFTRENLLKWISPMPKDDRLFFDGKIKENITKEELKTIISEMLNGSNNSVDSFQPTPKKGIPSIYKKGDVLMHPIFNHPYILLEKNNSYWICGLLTSEEKCGEILEKCDSRFFHCNFFTRVIFTTVEPVGKFMYPFENPKQVKTIHSKLKQIFIV